MMLQVPGGDPTEAEIDAFLDEHIPRLYGLIHLGSLALNRSKEAVLRQIMERKEIPQVCVSGFSEFPHVGSAIADIEPAMQKVCDIMKNSDIHSLGIIRRPDTPGNSPFTYISRFREDTMRKIAADNRINVIADIPVDDMAAVEKMLAAPNRPGAIFCHNSRTAEKIVALARKMALDIPGDVAVFGYDLKAADANLARIDPKAEEVAAAAVDLICRHFDEGVTPENRVAKITAGFINGSTLTR
jgi:DNA-binding LacI/PurR family transcriptional regulator